MICLHCFRLSHVTGNRFLYAFFNVASKLLSWWLVKLLAPLCIYILFVFITSAPTLKIHHLLECLNKLFISLSCVYVYKYVANTYIYIYIYIYTAAYIIYTITLYNQPVYWHCGLISWFLHGADFRLVGIFEHILVV